MSINLELLYGCIDYLENQFIHAVRISALLDQQIFQFYKALKQKASIMAIHINMKCFFSHTMRRVDFVSTFHFLSFQISL